MSDNSHTENYFSGENNRYMYDVRSSQAIALFDEVKAKFPWANKDDAFAISSPLQHEILNEPIISFTLTGATTKALVGEQYTLTTRKFCMTSSTSFLKVYPVWNESYPSFLPAGCTVMFKSEHRVEFGRPAPSGLDNFYDCYFKGDPATVETHFELTERRGNYDTFYGVTVKDGAVVRKKQYVYDSSSMFTDWDVIHMMQKRRA